MLHIKYYNISAFFSFTQFLSIRPPNNPSQWRINYIWTNLNIPFLVDLIVDLIDIEKVVGYTGNQNLHCLHAVQNYNFAHSRNTFTWIISSYFYSCFKCRSFGHLKKCLFLVTDGICGGHSWEHLFKYHCTLVWLNFI